MRWRLLLALGLVFLPAPARAALTAKEEALVRSVRAGVPAGRVLLETAVNQNSGTLNPDGVRAVGALFRPEFERLGFTTRWVDGAAWNRAGHLLAERRGPQEGLHVLLIGHLDTVFEPASPFQRYEALSDSTARGPGATDMKGGIVVMLLALSALRETGALDDLSVSVVLSGDEENPGAPLDLARRDLREAAERARVAIGFEDGDGDPRSAVVARRGSSGWVLRTAGRPSHSSQIFRPDVGSGAIYEAARILSAFHDSLSGEPYLTFNPGVILGGTTVEAPPGASGGSAYGKSNVIAESTLVRGDLRTLSREQLERAKRAMARIVDAHLPHTTAEIRFEDSYPPMAPTEGNLRLLALFDAVSRDLGQGPVTADDPARAGAADISFIADLVEMALDGVGLMGTGGHTVSETADVRTLASQAERVAVLLRRLSAR